MDKLLLVDDEKDVQYSFRRIFDSPEVELTTADSGEEALKLIPKLRPDLVLMDVRMGGITGLETLRRLRQIDAKLPVIMMTAYGTTQTAIEAMKYGAYDYLLKPFDVPKLKEIVFAALKAAHDMKHVVSFRPLLESEDYEVGVVGRSEAMQRVFKLIGQLAGSDATALITGESGTGKELVARAIYHNSQRSDKPFLAINCAAIPENLLESELFGHEKGAFTGANTQRVGKFEQCNGGTIFLDEIGDMSLPTQTKILRVLQNGAFERVGGNSLVKVNVRVIAATNKPLEQAVAAREFREDLFYRLNVVRIQMPALRERREDIHLLVNYFLRKFAQLQKQTPKSISSEVISIFESYHWPGNVRELENVIHRSMVVAKGDAILRGDIPLEIATGRLPTSASPAAVSMPVVESIAASGLTSGSGIGTPSDRPTDLVSLSRLLFSWARKDTQLKIIPAVERELIIQALAETKGNQVQAAKILGITRATLRKRVDKFGIKQMFSIS
ncbi:MAG: sigma-54 dependent transcriptional regulator [Verrucomicrobia bacterium]|nr:sigma-54 dependent transcriptional regulator [Verrucomicrobiota bacterium]